MSESPRVGALKYIDWEPESFVQHLARGWQLGDAEDFVSHFASVIHPDVTSQQPLSEPLRGRTALEHQFRSVFRLLPGMTATIRSWGAAFPNVYVEFDVIVPTGTTPFHFETCDRFTLSEGLIVDRRVYFDPGTLLDFVAGRQSR